MIKNTKNIVFLDGAMGTMLSKMDKEAGAPANISAPEAVKDIHKQYINAGADIIETNTFSVTSLKFKNFEEVNKIAFSLAHDALKESGASKVRIAAGIGPTGYMVKPVGKLDFEEAVNLFRAQIEVLCNEGADLVLIETMDDISELRAAMIAAKEVAPGLPLFTSMTFTELGYTSTGTPAEVAARVMDTMGADVLGVNCSFGPEKLADVVKRMRRYTKKDIIAQANAGMPEMIDGKTVYNVKPREYANLASLLVKSGASYIGGCCGTSPEYIKALKTKLADFKPKAVPKKIPILISGRTEYLEFTDYPLVIGERINFIAHPELQDSLDKVVKEGLRQKKAGADALDVNIGAQEDMLLPVVEELSKRVGLPVVLDSQNPEQINKVARKYPGILLLNSISGESKKLKELLPLAAQYGMPFVGLCLDDTGVPSKVADKLKVYRDILVSAEKAGIASDNIIIDPLTLSVSADEKAGLNTLKAISKIPNHTILGISNISSFLPDRALLNQTFSAMAVSAGCSALIVNPMDSELMYSIYSAAVLSGRDKKAKKYTEFMNPSGVDFSFEHKLSQAIFEGDSNKAVLEVKHSLKTDKEMDIIHHRILPALDKVGEFYREHLIFLPQLIESAKAAESAMNIIEKKLMQTGTQISVKGKILIATVQGDIHDIGKSLVALLLKNSSFDVKDMGVDVSNEKIIEEVSNWNPDLIALSSLMTTTMGRMKDIVDAIAAKGLKTPVVIGGAAVNSQYAESIGAHYGKDAVEAVKIASDLVAK